MTDLKWRELVEKSRQGDTAAFEVLYNETKRSVYFTALRMLADEENAKDVMQDTFITAMEKLNDLEDGANFPKWVNSIAINKCRRYFRKLTVDSLDEQLEQGYEIKDDENFIPDEYVSNEVKRKVIMDIITNVLSDVQRQTIIMYYYNEMSLEEISKVMNCSVKTVSSRLCSAREKIKEAVLIYEKKQGDRLHAIVPVPILTLILRMEAEKLSVPDISLNFNKPSQTSANMKISGGRSMSKTMMIKTAAIVAVVGLTVGGIAAALKSGKTGKDITHDASSINEQESSYVSEIAENTDTNISEISAAETETSEMEDADPYAYYKVLDEEYQKTNETSYVQLRCNPWANRDTTFVYKEHLIGVDDFKIWTVDADGNVNTIFKIDDNQYKHFFADFCSGYFYVDFNGSSVDDDPKYLFKKIDLEGNEIYNIDKDDMAEKLNSILGKNLERTDYSYDVTCDGHIVFSTHDDKPEVVVADPELKEFKKVETKPDVPADRDSYEFIDMSYNNRMYINIPGFYLDCDTLEWVKFDVPEEIADSYRHSEYLIKAPGYGYYTPYYTIGRYLLDDYIFDLETNTMVITGMSNYYIHSFCDRDCHDYRGGDHHIDTVSFPEFVILGTDANYDYIKKFDFDIKSYEDPDIVALNDEKCISIRRDGLYLFSFEEGPENAKKVMDLEYYGGGY